MAARCKAKNGQGEPCGMSKQKGSDWCFAHDPERKRERDQARRVGGLHRAPTKVGTGGITSIDLNEPGQLEALVTGTILDTLEQDNTDKRSAALAKLMRVWMDYRRQKVEEEEIAELRRNLEELRGHVQRVGGVHPLGSRA
jgi:hypothetical protein